MYHRTSFAVIQDKYHNNQVKNITLLFYYSSSRSQSCKSTVTIISAALSMFICFTSPSLTAIEVFFDFVNGEALRQHKIDVLRKNALIGGY